MPTTTTPVQLWWCADTGCGWVGRKPPGRDLQCPKCNSEDVFADEHLICPGCKEEFYSRGKFGGQWENQRLGSVCPNCTEKKRDGTFKGDKLPILVRKPPRRTSL